METANQEPLDAVFQEHGYTDYMWIAPEEIIVAQWVRMKCMFGCNEYGRNATCPPNTPSIDECERYFKEFTKAAVFHFQKQVEEPEERTLWSRALNERLLELERDFLDNHLMQWGPACLQKAYDAARTPFYQGVACLGIGTLHETFPNL